SIHPVPATDRAWIDIPLAHAARVTVDLYDLSGSLVRSVHNGPLLPGDHRIGLDTREIPAGMYVIRVLAGEERVALNLVIAH
ncbi:MAG TPA: T9SS type A sorting domain-containing protein, partial [Flavobacteriales bacterium]|nr:T9SS type A sorting domain-containing protein [Flavobacteriales bacterium]